MPLGDPHFVTREVRRNIESRAQQGPGNRRSIFFAALLSISVPVVLTLLHAYLATDRYFLKVDLKKEKSNISILTLKNESRRTIENLLLNFNYRRSKLTNHAVTKQTNSITNIYEFARKPKVSNSNQEKENSPYTCGFKIEYFPPKTSIIIHLYFEKTNEDFSIKEILGKNIYIISGWYGKLWINYYYFIISIVFFGCLLLLVYYIYRYYNSSKIANKLTYHINFIVESLARNKNPWKEKDLKEFYETYKELRSQTGDTAKDFLDFKSFVENNDLLLKGKDPGPGFESYICFAPFGFLGSPTYSKIFAKNKKALFLFFDKEEKISKVVFENLKDIRV